MEVYTRLFLQILMSNFAELVEISAKADTFSYAELRAATGDFNFDNKLGEGGFGSVFKVS